MIKRREFIAGVAGAAAWPLAARAQQQALPVAGFLTDGSLERRRDQGAMFLKGLGEVGYVEGRNVAIEYRWAEDRTTNCRVAADLIHEKVSVIATLSTASALAVKAATKSIPIVAAGRACRSPLHCNGSVGAHVRTAAKGGMDGSI
jgi:putative ABC transport system substrate-binding protein